MKVSMKTVEVSDFHRRKTTLSYWAKVKKEVTR
jgi:hypothetical protein